MSIDTQSPLLNLLINNTKKAIDLIQGLRKQGDHKFTYQNALATNHSFARLIWCIRSNISAYISNSPDRAFNKKVDLIPFDFSRTHASRPLTSAAWEETLRTIHNLAQERLSYESPLPILSPPPEPPPPPSSSNLPRIDLYALLSQRASANPTPADSAASSEPQQNEDQIVAAFAQELANLLAKDPEQLVVNFRQCLDRGLIKSAIFIIQHTINKMKTPTFKSICDLSNKSRSTPVILSILLHKSDINPVPPPLGEMCKTIVASKNPSFIKMVFSDSIWKKIPSEEQNYFCDLLGSIFDPSQTSELQREGKEQTFESNLAFIRDFALHASNQMALPNQEMDSLTQEPNFAAIAGQEVRQMMQENRLQDLAAHASSQTKRLPIHDELFDWLIKRNEAQILTLLLKLFPAPYILKKTKESINSISDEVLKALLTHFANESSHLLIIRGITKLLIENKKLEHLLFYMEHCTPEKAVHFAYQNIARAIYDSDDPILIGRVHSEPFWSKIPEKSQSYFLSQKWKRQKKEESKTVHSDSAPLFFPIPPQDLSAPPLPPPASGPSKKRKQ